MLAEVLRAEEPRFLRGDKKEHLRAPRLDAFGGGVGDCEHGRDAGSIVGSSVVDRITVNDWANSEVVPVCAVNHVFIADLGIDAMYDAHHVVGGQMPQTVLHRLVDDDAGVDGTEIARLRLLAQRRHVESCLCEERGRSTVGNPATDGERSRRVGGACQQPMFDRVGPHDYLPAVTGGGSGVDDEHPGGTATFRFFVLVGPAAVVRHRLTTQQVRFGGRSGRIVYENEEDFATDVRTLEVVPFVFGCGSAVADEDELTVSAARLTG